MAHKKGVGSSKNGPNQKANDLESKSSVVHTARQVTSSNVSVALCTTPVLT